jgi:hypothetical protein
MVPYERVKPFVVESENMSLNNDAFTRFHKEGALQRGRLQRGCGAGASGEDFGAGR